MFPDLSHCGGIEDVGLAVRWDSGAFAGQVTRRAAVLAQHGVGPHSVVAILHSGSALFFADLFAVWSVGAAAACLDGSLTDAELQNVLGFVKPTVALVSRSRAVESLEHPVLELAGASAVTTSVPAWDGKRAAEGGPDLPALILFTSGTTGRPKGVVLTFQALQTRIGLNITAIGSDVLRRALVTLPTHFGHGLIGNALTPLLSGGDIVLCPPADLRRDLGRIIDRHAVTFMSSVPALWNLVLRTGAPPAGESLRRVHVGSAPLSAKLWSEIVAWTRADVVNCLGMTETANWIAGASSRTDGIADGLVGRPWGGEAAVLDDHGTIQTVGAGEIVVRSPTVTAGYLNRPDLTAAVMVDGWFRTGDRGTVDEQGRIWLTGRIKDEINRAGFKVQPAEIDMVIERHPAVAEACVFGIPDTVSGEVVGAAVRLKEGAAADPAGLQAWCRKQVRREAVPERWFMVEAIPRNARGKVNRDAVRRHLAGTADTTTGADARAATAGNDANNQGPLRVASSASPAVKVVVERAWTRVLGRQSFRADTPWDKAGGDSLGAMRLWLQIEQQLGMPLPLDRMEFNTTPSRLIGAIEKLVGASGQGRADAVSNPRQPRVFLLPPAFGDMPTLAQFRAAFNGRVRFEVIRYPALDPFLDGGAGFDLLVDAAVAQIRALDAPETCYLAGYSFGGFVAWEVARRLMERGFEIGFLGLIDTRLVVTRRPRKTIYEKTRDYLRLAFNPAPLQDAGLRPTLLAAVRAFGVSLRDACGAVYGDVEWWFFELLARKCPWWILRRLNRLANVVPGSAGLMFQWELIARLRIHAYQRVTTTPLDVVATLFRSDERSGSTPDYGWGDMCRRLVVVPIQGDHFSLFAPENREMLCALFVQEVDAASTGRRTPAARVSKSTESGHELRSLSGGVRRARSRRD